MTYTGFYESLGALLPTFGLKDLKASLGAYRMGLSYHAKIIQVITVCS